MQKLTDFGLNISRFRGVFLFSASMLIGAVLTLGSAFAATVSITCGAVGAEQALCKSLVKQWEEKTGHSVNVISAPTSTTEQLALYQQILASGSNDIDIFQIDVIWPGILGSHFIDLAPYSNGAERDHFPSIISNNTVGGKLVAMPWFTDAGVLYYRKDLLAENGIEPPSSWQELTMAAKKIQDVERSKGNDKFWGFVFQGKAYEGLTCDALEWVDSFGGGEIINAAGEITINNDKAAQALELAASWVNDISPPGVLDYAEEEARGVFQSGDAAFMRNWPYAWSLGNSDDSPIKGKIGVSALPKGGADGKHTGTLGGWQLAVSKYSQNPEIAADLVMHLVSHASQKLRAIEGSYNPTIAALYSDSDVLAATPFFGDLYDTFTNAVARPSRATGASYNKVSNAFWNAVHDTLSGSNSAKDALASLESELKRIKKRGW